MGNQNTSRAGAATHVEASKREAAETALGDAQEVFRLLVEAVRDYAIFALDKNGNILTWNAGAKRLKGYEPHEIIGSHFSRFYTPEDIARQHPQFELQEAARNGSYEEEGWRVKKDGSRFWANVVITALKNKDGVVSGFAKVTRDLTERKNAQDKLRAAYDELEKRVEERTAELARAKDAAVAAVHARDEFLSIASHELKTPLTSLKLQIQMRKRHIAKGNLNLFTPEHLKAMVDDDEAQIIRIDRLVGEMLDITRLAAGKLPMEAAEMDLAVLVREVISRFMPQLEAANITVNIKGPAAVVGCWDYHRLEQVFTNLLTNTMKYGEGKPVEVELSQNATHALLSVRDHGIGIAKHDHERVFQQFERAASPHVATGLGLGLYIVKQIVEAHRGTVSVESELGKGSSFTVKIPLHPVPPQNKKDTT